MQGRACLRVASAMASHHSPGLFWERVEDEDETVFEATELAPGAAGQLLIPLSAANARDFHENPSEVLSQSQKMDAHFGQWPASSTKSLSEAKVPWSLGRGQRDWRGRPVYWSWRLTGTGRNVDRKLPARWRSPCRSSWDVEAEMRRDQARTSCSLARFSGRTSR